MTFVDSLISKEMKNSNGVKNDMQDAQKWGKNVALYSPDSGSQPTPLDVLQLLQRRLQAELETQGKWEIRLLALLMSQTDLEVQFVL